MEHAQKSYSADYQPHMGSSGSTVYVVLQLGESPENVLGIYRDAESVIKLLLQRIPPEKLTVTADDLKGMAPDHISCIVTRDVSPQLRVALCRVDDEPELPPLPM